jgi:hypothetical protein
MRRGKAVVALFIFLSLWACDVKKSPQSKNDPFLDSLSLKTFHYFWDQANPSNGLVPDRWPSPSFSSIAATGFGLTSYLIGVERGYVTREDAASRVLATLRFFHAAPRGDSASHVTGNHGFYYHFLDMKTGMRFQQVELSTIDTGLLMAGILSCQTYFDKDTENEREIRTLADSLYRAVEWDWAMNGRQTMSMGWHPERGFLNASWRGYNEGMILYIMGVASPTHPIPASSWSAWTSTYQWAKYYDEEHVNFGPLFGHQYSHMYIDYRGIQDGFMKAKGIDYFENSKRATMANRKYCIANPGGYSGYGSNQWGLTACDGPGNQNNSNPNVSFDGYNARGAAQHYTNDDGTIAPTAAGGSIPFAPEICISALKSMRAHYRDSVYGVYGFFDAFNTSIQNKNGTLGWFDKDYIGIDQGPIIIQIENYQTEFVWSLMKRNPYIVDGLHRCGFSGGWLDKR